MAGNPLSRLDTKYPRGHHNERYYRPGPPHHIVTRLFPEMATSSPTATKP